MLAWSIIDPSKQNKMWEGIYIRPVSTDPLNDLSTVLSINPLDNSDHTMTMMILRCRHI